MSIPDKPVCRETLAQIYLYLDRELTAETRLVIGHHLAECPPCGDLFGFESDLRRLVAQRCAEQPPPGLRDRIAASLGLESPSLGGPDVQLPGPPKL